MLDFTLEKYGELCRTLQRNYTIYPVYPYLVQQPSENAAIMRHDVDRKARNALAMAELEYEQGIRSTYYFRYPLTFDEVIIQRIRGLGHEIGYHYEVLSKAGGDPQKAIHLFQSELGEFQRLGEIHTICMHGSPLSRYDNRDLWRSYRFESFGIQGEAYLSLPPMAYFTDTGRNWGGENNLRDHLPGSEIQPRYASTDDLIRALGRRSYSHIYLSVHPERWGDSRGEWIAGYATDVLFNLGKRVLRVMHA